MDDCHFKVDDVMSTVRSLSHGKSDDSRGPFSDYVNHGTQRFLYSLSKLCNVLLIHGMSPSAMLQSVMMPIPKNKLSQGNKSDNFRAICLPKCVV